jgi:dTDP-4-amino-4,6-dideoxygalactose transaminase
MKSYNNYIKRIKNETLPCYEPSIGNEEIAVLKKVINSGWLSENKYTRIFEKKIAKYSQRKFSLAFNNATAAMITGMKALNLGKNNEVIVPTFTHSADVNAISAIGANPVFADVDKNTLCLSLATIKKVLTKKTKAILFVALYGNSGEIKKINNFCKKKKIFLICDCAAALGSMFEKRQLSSYGIFSVLSFFCDKTITTGEGGMCVFKKKRHFAQAKAWHDHGHENNPKFPRWEDTRKSSGFNFRITELQSAVGLAQLEKFNDIYKHHEKNKKKLFKVLKNFKNIKFRKIFKDTKPASEAIVFFVKNKKIASLFRLELLKVGISTKILPEALTWHFALHWNHINELKKSKNQYYKSIKILSKAVSLPIFYKMENNFYKKVDWVCRKVFNEI